MNRFFTALLSTVLLCGIHLSSAIGGESLSNQELDSFLDSLFKRNQKLTFFQAQIEQLKSGGVFRRPDQKQGKLWVHLPDRFLLDMSDDGLKILMDGRYAWLHDTDLDDVERYTVKKKDPLKQSEALESNGFALFLGQSQASLETIHQNFELSGEKKGEIYQITFLPKTAEMKKKMTRLEIEIHKDALLPNTIQTISSSTPNSRRAPLTTKYTLTQVQTNLGGLAPFASRTFLFPIRDDLEIRDMTHADGQRALDPKELKIEQEKRIQQQTQDARQ